MQDSFTYSSMGKEGIELGQLASTNTICIILQFQFEASVWTYISSLHK